LYYGYPATKAGGYFKKVPGYGKYVAPFGKSPFGKSPFGKYPYGKSPYPYPYSPYSKAGGYGSVVPSTTVITSPYPI
jgi:hypothetical protein